MSLRTRWQHASLRTKVLLVFSIPALLVIGMTVWVGQGLRELAAAREWVLHSQKVIQQAEKLTLNRVTLTEQAMAYLLIGAEDFRQQYQERGQQLARDIEALQQMVSDNPEQVAKLQQLEHLVRSWQQEMEDLLARRPEVEAGRLRMSQLTAEVIARQGGLDALERQMDAVAQGFIATEQQLNSERLARMEQQERMVWIAVLISLLALLGGIGLTFQVLRRSILRPLQELETAARRISEGNLDTTVSIQTEDEIGRLAHAFNQMVEGMRRAIDALQEEKASVEQKVREAVAESEAQRRYLAEHIEYLLAQIERFAMGDLTVELEAQQDDEIGRLYEGFNRAVANMRQMLVRVAEAITMTASAAAQISASSEELAASSQQQAAQANEVAAAVEEMVRTIIENARGASETAEIARNNEERARQGGQVVQEMIEKIRRIGQVVGESAQTVERLGASSERIGEIVQMINEIAEQTNLLALNAAIEAARAGEHGRGFAVVADEVRKLAERTAAATKEIAQMIETIRNETQEAVQAIRQGNKEMEGGILLADQTGATFTQIVEGAQQVMERITQIAAASEEQSTTSEQISRSVEMISNLSHESARGVDQIARATENLSRLTDELNQRVGQFRLEMQEATRSTNGMASRTA